MYRFNSTSCFGIEKKTGTVVLRIPLGLPDGRDYAIANSAIRCRGLVAEDPHQLPIQGEGKAPS